MHPFIDSMMWWFFAVAVLLAIGVGASRWLRWLDSRKARSRRTLPERASVPFRESPARWFASHPWRAFWLTVAGSVVLNLLFFSPRFALMSVEFESAAHLVAIPVLLAQCGSYAQGVRVTWQRSHARAVLIVGAFIVFVGCLHLNSLSLAWLLFVAVAFPIGLPLAAELIARSAYRLRREPAA
jgi:hypothetical protein